jgi:hypothetical protein
MEKINNNKSSHLLLLTDPMSMLDRIKILLRQDQVRKAFEIYSQLKYVFPGSSRRYKKQYKPIERELKKSFNSRFSALNKMAGTLKKKVLQHRDINYLSTKFDISVLKLLIEVSELFSLCVFDQKIKREVICCFSSIGAMLSHDLKSSFSGDGQLDGINLFHCLELISFCTMPSTNIYYDMEAQVSLGDIESSFIFCRKLAELLLILVQRSVIEGNLDDYNARLITKCNELNTELRELERRKQLIDKLTEDISIKNKEIKSKEKELEDISEEIKNCKGKMDEGYKTQQTDRKSYLDINVKELKKQLEKQLEQLKKTKSELAANSEEKIRYLKMQIKQADKVSKQLKPNSANIDLTFLFRHIEFITCKKIIALKGTFDALRPYSVLRAIEIIGEQFTNKIFTPKTRRRLLTDKQVRDIVGLRNALIHWDWYLYAENIKKLEELTAGKQIIDQDIVEAINSIISAVEELAKSDWQQREVSYYADAFDNDPKCATNGAGLDLTCLETMKSKLVFKDPGKAGTRLSDEEYCKNILQTLLQQLQTMKNCLEIPGKEVNLNIWQEFLSYGEGCPQLELNDQFVENMLKYYCDTVCQISYVFNFRTLTQGPAQVAIYRDPHRKQLFDEALRKIRKYHNGKVKVFLPRSGHPDVDYSHGERQKKEVDKKEIVDAIMKSAEICDYLSALSADNEIMSTIEFMLSSLQNMFNKLPATFQAAIEASLDDQLCLEFRFLRNHFAHGHDPFSSHHNRIEILSGYYTKFCKFHDAIQKVFNEFKKIVASTVPNSSAAPTGIFEHRFKTCDILTSENIKIISTRLLQKWEVESLDRDIGFSTTNIPVGFELIKVAGDGNCFFHAVAGLLDSGETHEELRAKVVEYVIDNIAALAGFLNMSRDDYILSISTTGEWADNVAIFALAKAMNLHILVHRADGTINEINSETDGGRRVDLAYNGVHYDGLRQNVHDHHLAQGK